MQSFASENLCRIFFLPDLQRIRLPAASCRLRPAAGTSMRRSKNPPRSEIPWFRLPRCSWLLLNVRSMTVEEQGADQEPMLLHLNNLQAGTNEGSCQNRTLFVSAGTRNAQGLAAWSRISRSLAERARTVKVSE